MAVVGHSSRVSSGPRNQSAHCSMSSRRYSDKVKQHKKVVLILVLGLPAELSLRPDRHRIHPGCDTCQGVILGYGLER